jgi:hypothetical protein
MIQMDGKLWGLKKKYPVLRELVKELGHKNQERMKKRVH